MKLFGIAGLSLLGCVGAAQLGAWGNSTTKIGLGLGDVWEFPLPSEWVALPPLDYSYGTCNYAAVTATNLATGAQETGYLKWGTENMGSCASNECSGGWGRFCMVNGAKNKGIDDFPFFNTWTASATPNCQTTSDSNWGGECNGAVLTIWAQLGSGWETVYAWSGADRADTQSWTRTMVAGETIRLGFDAAGGGSNAPPPPPPTAAPSAAPTAAPTAAPAPAAQSSSSGVTSGPTSAKGDPHLQNINGQRFDLMQPGRHVLLHIPRGADAPHILLRVEAEVQRLGPQCGDMYFQHINITGAWVDSKHNGILQFHAGDVASEEEATWMNFGAVNLKVVHAQHLGGIRYLNIYAKHLGRVQFKIGGLLGEDDHEYEATPDEGCVSKLSFYTKSPQDPPPSTPSASSAEASLA